METNIDNALTRAQTEAETLETKHSAFREFVTRIEELQPATPQQSSQKVTTAGTLSQQLSSTQSDCRPVRTAFAETVQPHSDARDSLLTAVREELSDSIAAALAPTTETPFSPELQQMILSAARTRQTETGVLHRAIERERDQLADAKQRIETITAWLATADETPLLELGFETLQNRHETLAAHRDSCTRLLEQRQEFLDRTTNKNAEVGVDHRSLVPSLYEDFSVEYPLLATVSRLDSVCADCQRAVRDHLVRRV